jgi:hypothetical protein
MNGLAAEVKARGRTRLLAQLTQTR